MNYNTITYNCAKYMEDKKANFGIVIMYTTGFDVKFMQIYRKGILVTFVNGEFIANDKKDARFVGLNTWDTVYTDAGEVPPETGYRLSDPCKCPDDHYVPDRHEPFR